MLCAFPFVLFVCLGCAQGFTNKVMCGKWGLRNLSPY